MLHRIQWQAATPFLDMGSPQQATLQLHLSRHGLRRASLSLPLQRLAQTGLGQHTAAHQAVRTAAAVLQTVQESSAAGSVMVLTACLGSSSESYGHHSEAEGLASAVGHALLRVAAAERPECQFQALSNSAKRGPRFSAAIFQSQQQSGTDAFGRHNEAGNLHLPVLQTEAQGGRTAGVPRCSSVMITGGLGGLGRLVGLYMGQGSAQRILLLGRSGRGDLDMHSLGNACVTLHRCDVASAEEVRVPPAGYPVSNLC